MPTFQFVVMLEADSYRRKDEAKTKLKHLSSFKSHNKFQILSMNLGSLVPLLLTVKKGLPGSVHQQPNFPVYTTRYYGDAANRSRESCIQNGGKIHGQITVSCKSIKFSYGRDLTFSDT